MGGTNFDGGFLVMSLTLTQTASDNFTRANENPLAHPPWTQNSTNALQVVSNLCETTSVSSGEFEIYSGTTLAANQYAGATFGAAPALNDSALYIFIRDQFSSSAELTADCYALALICDGTSSSLTLYACNGSPTAIASLSSLTVSSGDVWDLAAVGSTLYIVQNGTILTSVTDATWASGSYSALGIQANTALTDIQLSLFSIGTASNASTFSISGNAGTVAGATVSYSGTAIGSVQTTAGGAYTISGLAAGNYTITPSLAGVSFSPLSQNVTIASSNVTGINFATGAWSPVDSRVNKPNSATFRTVQGAQICDVQTSSNPAVPGVDSRAAGKPKDCRVAPNIPENSRTFPPFAD